MASLRQEAVCLRIFGDDVIPGVLNEVLGLPASIAWKKGELWSNKGVGQLRDTGGWILNGRWDSHPNINDQIVQIFGQLTVDQRIWFDLTKRFTVDVFCGLFLHEDSGCSALQSGTLALLVSRHICLNVEVYEREVDLRQV